MATVDRLQSYMFLRDAYNEELEKNAALIRRVERYEKALIAIAENEIKGSVVERWASEALKEETD